MKTLNLFYPAALAALCLVSLPTEASGRYGGVVYDSQAARHAIHSYPGSSGSPVKGPQLVYVSQAWGPAIHGYPGVRESITVPLDMHYVDQAYGQAIYSYPQRPVSGEVNVLPMTVQ